MYTTKIGENSGLFVIRRNMMEPMEDASTVERILMNEAREKGIPINGSLELLPLCNMNCDMCYVRLSKEEMNRLGKMRSLEEWLSVAKQMQQAGVLFLLLTGGEPLLYPYFKELFIALKKMGMILTINTNGTLIDEKWASFFKEYKPRRINITLYGADKKTYQELCHYPEGYDRTIQAIRLLRANDIDVKVGYSVTKANLASFKQVLSLEKELDVPIRADTYMMPSTRERNKPYAFQARLDPITAARARVEALKIEMGEQLFRQYVQKSLFEVENILPGEGTNHPKCHAGSCSFTINWQGNMHPCVVLDTPSINVFEVGFDAAWQVMMDKTKQIVLSDQCHQCSLRPICRTCQASALLETGSYEGTPEYMCEYSKETLRLLREEYEHGKNFSDR